MELSWILAKDVLTPPPFLLEIDEELPQGALLGIAAVMLALRLGYYLVRRTHRQNGRANPESMR